MKKNVILRCRCCDTISDLFYFICVYDNKNSLIFKGKTDGKGNIKVEFPCYGIYKLFIVDCKKFIKNCVIVLIDEDFPEEFTIVSSILCKKNHPIKFSLTDRNYKNLPIMKGEFKIWPKST